MARCWALGHLVRRTAYLWVMTSFHRIWFMHWLLPKMNVLQNIPALTPVRLSALWWNGGWWCRRMPVGVAPSLSSWQSSSIHLRRIMWWSVCCRNLSNGWLLFSWNVIIQKKRFWPCILINLIFWIMQSVSRQLPIHIFQKSRKTWTLRKRLPW